jgi:hypothetical protein
MAVYVDDAKTLVALNGCRVAKLCHLFADTSQELERMAGLLGLPLYWLHGDHYDVTCGLRLEAIALGAVPVAKGEAAHLIGGMRRTKFRHRGQHYHIRRHMDQQPKGGTLWNIK